MECMASAWLSSARSDSFTRDRATVLAQVETKSLNLLILLFTIDTTSIEGDLLYEIALLSATLHALSKQASSNSRLYELALTFDIILLHFMTEYSKQDPSHVLDRLSHDSSPAVSQAFSLFLQLCRSVGIQFPIMDNLRGAFPMHDRDGMTSQIVTTLTDTLHRYNLPALADSLKTRWTQMQDSTDEANLSSFRLGISGVDALEQDSLKRRRSFTKATKRKRIKAANGTAVRHISKRVERETSDEADSDSSDAYTSQWSNSISDEDTAGEQDTESSEQDSGDSTDSPQNEYSSTDGDRTVLLDSIDHEEEQKDGMEEGRADSIVNSSRTSTPEALQEGQDDAITQSARKRILQVYSTSPARSRPPVLRSVFSSNNSLLLGNKLPKYAPTSSNGEGHLVHRSKVGMSRTTMPSSDDDLDLLVQRQWSTP